MHHVVLENPHSWHCFSQFGSGTFEPDCETLLSRFMLINPYTLQKEAEYLKNKGLTNVEERMFIDLDCVVITPMHMLINRILETLRGKNRYGSTGMGVGLAMEEAFLNDPQGYP